MPFGNVGPSWTFIEQ